MSRKGERMKQELKSINKFMELTEDQKKEHIKKLSPKELWHLVLAIGRKQEPESKGITNHFNRDDVTTIIANMEFFGATDIWMRQTIFDLMTPKFRLFDFLGMCIMSRNDDNRKQNNLPLKVLIWAYLKMNGVPEKFIEDLRVIDYQIDGSYNCVQDILEW